MGLNIYIVKALDDRMDLKELFFGCHTISYNRRDNHCTLHDISRDYNLFPKGFGVLNMESTHVFRRFKTTFFINRTPTPQAKYKGFCKKKN